MQSSSWIRKMFEEGAKLRALHGDAAVHDFSLGNPVLEPPPRVLAALVRAADPGRAGAHRYMPNAGYPDVRAAVARHLVGKTGLPFEGKHVVMSVGAGGGLNVVMKTLLDAGDEVILLTPYFVEYDFYVDNHGGVPVHVPTDDAFQLDLGAIDRAITSKTKAILLNSPNNPCGVVYPKASVDALGELLRQASKRIGRTIAIVTDEPYRYISYGVDVPWVFGSYEHVVLVTSHSKDLALPGERIGYIAFDPRLAEVDQMVAGATFATRTLGFVNAPAIQQRAVAELQGFTVDPEVYRAKRDRLYGALRDAGYEVVFPDGAFYMFPKTPLDDDVAFVRLLLEELILAVPGTGFGRPGHMRLSYCVDDATIERAIPGLQRAFRRASGSAS
ncbi:MAG: pyridoxal phosphate-dependent aminotransferase [Planctomycetes bacterium]|nr:pyridoxal phosphate-dependent aminotransferase [Planctomycetota bacterium]